MLNFKEELIMTEEQKAENIKNLKYAKAVTVDGVEYILQKLPVRPGLELRQDCREGGDLNEIKFFEQLLENVVIKPKKKLDDFDDIGHLEKLMEKVIDYQYKGK